MNNTAEKKMTKRAYFEQLKSKYPFTKDEVEFIDKQIASLDKKSSGERKPTATQLANEVLKNAIVDYMQSNTMYTVTSIIKSVPECDGLSQQKVTAMFRQLVDSGKVTKTTEKGKTYFVKNIG